LPLYCKVATSCLSDKKRRKKAEGQGRKERKNTHKRKNIVRVASVLAFFRPFSFLSATGISVAAEGRDKPPVAKRELKVSGTLHRLSILVGVWGPEFLPHSVHFWGQLWIGKAKEPGRVLECVSLTRSRSPTEKGLEEFLPGDRHPLQGRDESRINVF